MVNAGKHILARQQWSNSISSVLMAGSPLGDATLSKYLTYSQVPTVFYKYIGMYVDSCATLRISTLKINR